MYGTVTPHVDVKTFNRWVREDGLRPIEKEHAKRVGPLRLFHKSQCRPLTAEEAAGFKAKFAERAAADKAKVVPLTGTAAKLPPVELVPQAAPAVKKATVSPIHA
jgi:hypothetical protein